MKLKKIILDNYIYKDRLGSHNYNDVNAYIDEAQEKSDYFIDDAETDKLSRLNAIHFFNDKSISINNGTKPMSAEEFKGISEFLGILGSDFAKILGIDKSSITRIFKSEIKLKKDLQMLSLERLKDEIDRPGFSKDLVRTIDMKKPEKETSLGLDAVDIANAVLYKFLCLDIYITHLKLQKIIYYVEGTALGKFYVSVFKNKIFAWKLGPVVKEIYDKYRLEETKSRPIENIDENAAKKLLIEYPILDKIIDLVIHEYGHLSPSQLVDRTHGEKPWIETSKQNEISRAKIKEYFSSILI